MLSGVLPCEAAGGTSSLKTRWVSNTGPPTLPVYLLSEVCFAGRSPDDRYQSVFKDEKLSDYFIKNFSFLCDSCVINAVLYLRHNQKTKEK